MKVYGTSWLLLQFCLVVSGVSGFSLSGLISQFHSLSISTSNTAQQLEGWGTSLSWFGEYVGSLEGITVRKRGNSADHLCSLLDHFESTIAGRVESFNQRFRFATQLHSRTE